MIEYWLFPFEKIEKGSKIVVYGAGDFGQRILSVVKSTEFCDIVCFLDKNYTDKNNFAYKVLPPEAIKHIDSYSTIIVSIHNEEQSQKAKNSLLNLGVPEEKIIVLIEERRFFLNSYIPKPEYITKSDNNSLSIAFFLYGGIGDEIMASLLIKEVRRLITAPFRIDCYCNAQAIMSQMPFIDNVYPLKNHINNKYSYDIEMEVMRYVKIRKINLEKVKYFSDVLYNFCQDSIRAYELCPEFKAYSDYCLIKGKNRLEQNNPHCILPFDRYAATYMGWDVAGFEKLFQLGLDSKKYITICNDVDNNLIRSPKLWPNEYFEKLIELIKANYKDITVISIGANCRFGKPGNADIDLIGKTSLPEFIVLLKYSLLNIAIEGGTIHLRHFLNGKSICLFGPTSIDEFGYEENYNIKSGFPKQCAGGCSGIITSADRHCLLAEDPLCMAALKPEKVYETFTKALESITEYTYKIDEQKYDNISQILNQNDNIALIGRKNEVAVFDCADSVNSITAFSDDLPIAKKSNIKTEYGFIYNISAKDNAYDVVFNFALYEAKCPELALREMLRITRENGKCITEKDGLIVCMQKIKK